MLHAAVGDAAWCERFVDMKSGKAVHCFASVQPTLVGVRYM